MYYDDESGAVPFAAGLLLGAMLGASLAFLTAPQSGRRTRKRLIRAVSGASDAVGDRWEGLASDVERVVRRTSKKLR